MVASKREAFHPISKGYPTRLRTNTKAMPAMGNKNTSVLDKKGRARYPRWVMYQYQEKAAAYNVLDNKKANKDLPNTNGNKKN
mmetsp:Transcript_23872/g.40533  ORF Transcript_23872/g.40533 Transcript_23872/m.40533 type:complete len:83 (+) Transcript_23872:7-255(+)